jgi:cytoskeletal protein CcmA (bactofilin family)
MFSKPDKPISSRPSNSRLEPSEPNGRKALAASLIAPNVTLEGDLTSDGDVQLDGTVRGDLKVARLTIGETGQVVGAVEAESVEIRGRVTGTISAKAVRLYGAAHVDGDITHDQLSIEAGAHFAGRSLKLTIASETLSIAHAAAAE